MNFKKTLQKNKELAIIIFIFIFAHIYFFFDNRIIIWDEATYIGIGKNLYSLGQSGLFEILRPLGLPIILGFFWKIGFDVFIAGKTIALFFSIGSIVLTYKISEKAFNKSVAIISAMLLSLSPLFFLYSTFLLTEIPSLFFALLSIWFYISGRKILSPISAAIALLFRFPQGVMLAVFGVVILIEHRKNLKKMLLSGLSFIGIYFLTVLPFLIFNYIKYRAEVSKVWHAVFRPFIFAFNAIEINNWMYKQDYFFFFRVLFQKEILIALFFLFIIFYFSKKLYKNNKVNLVFISLLLYLIYYTRLLHKEERYALVFLPFMVIFASYSIVEIFLSLGKRWKFISPKNHMIIFVLVFSSLAIVQDVQYYWWYPQKAQIEQELYVPIANRDIRGTILSTDPIISAFSDAKVNVVYYNIDEFYSEFEKNYSAIIYAKRAFYCQNPECEKKKEDAAGFLDKNYAMALNSSFNGEQYYFFVKN